MTGKGQTKFDRLLAVCAQIGSELNHLDHPSVEALSKLCCDTTAQLPAELENAHPPVRKSEAVTGLEQGLRDLTLIMSGLPEDVRHFSVKAYSRALDDNYPEFIQRDRERLARIIKRRRVRSESEWYTLQHRLDLIEGGVGNDDEIALLQRLMDDYEGTA